MVAAGLLALAGGSVIFRIYPEKNRPENNISDFGNPVAEMRLAGRDFSVEMASSEEKRRMGLSGRENMCRDCAMLFIFPEPSRPSFWMKDMRFDLDVVWISGTSVKAIEKNVPFARGEREVIKPDVPIDKVLELNAGVCDEIGLKIGDETGF